MVIPLIFLLWVVFIPPVQASVTEYKLFVTYNETTHQLEGSEEITFFNNGKSPLSEIVLILYPNRYLKKDPGISQNLYERAYPVMFNPGGIEVTSIKDVEGNDLSHSLEPDRDTLMRIQLTKPIAPQKAGLIAVNFITSLPEKKGVFGYYRDLATLQGGWHPYLPALIQGKWDLAHALPNSHFRVFFTVKDGLQLVGSDRPKLVGVEGKSLTFFMEGKNLPFFSLSIGETSIRHHMNLSGIELEYYAHSKSKTETETVLEALEEMILYFQNNRGPIPVTQLTLTDAYLFQELGTDGSQLLYINDRSFRIFFLLKRFHEMIIARELFFLFWREKLPDEETWVTEGLAYLDAKGFIQHKYGADRQLEDWLKPLAFFPVVDQILYSQTLPLREVYFPDATRPLLEEDLRFFNHPRLKGESIFIRLQALLGRKTFSQSIKNYREKILFHPRPSFRKILLEGSHHHKIDSFIDQWLKKSPRLDFGIEEIRRTRDQDKFLTRILIKKRGKGSEPLEILLTEKNGTDIPLIWNGVGESHEVVVTTPSRIKTVTLDPHKFSNDPNRLNNRSPPAWKVLLNDFSVNYDFQSRFLSYRAGLLFQRTYDTKNWIRLFFSRSDIGTVSQLDYTQTLQNRHIVSTGITREKRETSLGNLPEETADIINIGYALNYPQIPLLEENIQRLTGIFPIVSTRLRFNQKISDRPHDNSFFIELDLRRIFSLSNHHEISTRIFLGESFGRLFKNNRFFLGGSTGMRGYTSTVFEGENMALFSIEYRFPLFREADIPFLGLANQRTLQIALFADVGEVTDSRNIFQVKQYKRDIGAGLRFFMDVFGLYPTVVRFDVAVPIDSSIPNEDKPHYYLQAGQPF